MKFYPLELFIKGIWIFQIKRIIHISFPSPFDISYIVFNIWS